MFEHIHIELEYSEAVSMDTLFESNRSIKKKGELLNQNMDVYLPDQVTYLIMIILEDFLDKEDPEYSAVDRLLRFIDFNTVDANVLIALLRMLKTSEHLLKEHTKFYKESILRLNFLNLDADKIIKDL